MLAPWDIFIEGVQRTSIKVGDVDHEEESDDEEQVAGNDLKEERLIIIESSGQTGDSMGLTKLAIMVLKTYCILYYRRSANKLASRICTVVAMKFKKVVLIYSCIHTNFC
jgi:hypothetical protein